MALIGLFNPFYGNFSIFRNIPVWNIGRYFPKKMKNAAALRRFTHFKKLKTKNERKRLDDGPAIERPGPS